MAFPKIKIGMVGLGTVGSGVYSILSRHKEVLRQRVGAELELTRIAVRSAGKKRNVRVPKGMISRNLEDLIHDPEIKMIVEVMGDVRASRALALKAIRAGKHLVTANKALLALHGPELFEAARKHKVDICFEAAVGGGIPILRSLREGFVADQIQSLYGIVNGTCNYILSEMSEKGTDFASTLKMAQKLGFAEADPSFDIQGLDAAHKLAILVSIAYGVYVDFDKIHVEGIRRVTPLDLECARRFGYEIKLLAIAKKTGAKIQARVHSTMIPKSSMLAAVRGVHNAVMLDGHFLGNGMLYGEGAGSGPTATAVVGDVVEVARNILAGVGYAVPPLGTHAKKIGKASIEPVGMLKSCYYLRFQAIDRPGVLAQIANHLSRHNISISSVYQHVREEGKEVPIVVLTHEAVEQGVQKAVSSINALASIKRPTTLIRIEENCK